jgi:hypothetical protein
MVAMSKAKNAEKYTSEQSLAGHRGTRLARRQPHLIGE